MRDCKSSKFVNVSVSRDVRLFELKSRTDSEDRPLNVALLILMRLKFLEIFILYI